MRVRYYIIIVLSIIQLSNLHSQSHNIPRLSPIPDVVAGIDDPVFSLDGIWNFMPEFRDDYKNVSNADDWDYITVPGEWSIQGFRVDSGQATAYLRTFHVPEDWKGNRIKLRFNAVYSKSVIYVNGEEAGSHHGGFTAFELDITDLVSYKNENTLLLSVTSESLADSLASGSKYACHPLGGIPRSIYLFAKPEIHISSVFIQTDFDKDYLDADLIPIVGVVNESGKKGRDLTVKIDLLQPEKPLRRQGFLTPGKIPDLRSGDYFVKKLNYPIERPLKWDCENPNLYDLRINLLEDGDTIETVHQRIGFREVEVKGNQLFVNGLPVKLRGVNRHEVYPLTGRSVPKEMYRKDVELFREGNVNHIRTCHYPPDEALMEAADELGMFIECEGPFCWSHQTKGDSLDTRELTRNQLLEMIVQYRNHPSIIFWSIANESIWNEDYRLAGEAMKKLDPTRPLTFNYYPWGWVNNNQEDESVCEIGSDHYPSPKGPGKYSDYHRPISFGEFVHLNAYNRYELATDVALRDTWGIYLHEMWENMYKSQGVLGGSIWAGIDDTFYWDFINPDGSIEERTVGYGTWGPIDGWRRKKPEWWGMKKTYSPVKVSNVDSRYNNVQFLLENRQDFSNTNRLEINWTIGNDTGTISPDISPRSSDIVEINSSESQKNGARLKLEIRDPRGFLIDTYNLLIKSESIEYKVPDYGKTTMSVKENQDYFILVKNDDSVRISKSTGLLTFGNFVGPELMILPMNNGGDTQMHGPTKYYEPFNPVCSDWQVDSIVNLFNTDQEIKVYGSYKEAKGVFTYKTPVSSSIEIKYEFECLEDINPRQTGLVFTLPKEYENLSWKRKGYWSTYPDWHIARLEGYVRASEGYEATPVGPRSKPFHEWRLDMTSVGNNDFASTKHNILKASLTNNDGNGLIVNSFYAKLHSRSWLDNGKIRWLIANYSNGGSERFLRPHAEKDDLYLKSGDKIKGSLRLKMKDE